MTDTHPADMPASDVFVRLIRSIHACRAADVRWAAHVLGCSPDTAHRILSTDHPKARPPTVREALVLLEAAGTDTIARAAAHDAGLVVSAPTRGAELLGALATASSETAGAVTEAVSALSGDGRIDDTEARRIQKQLDAARARIDEASVALRGGR